MVFNPYLILVGISSSLIFSVKNRGLRIFANRIKWVKLDESNLSMVPNVNVTPQI